MDKYSVKQSLDCARHLEQQVGENSPHVFILNWIAWEQLGYRVLRVATYMDGWNQNTFNGSMRHFSQLGNGPSVQTMIQKLAGVPPKDFTGKAGETWNAVSEYRFIRNAFVHGGLRTKPETYGKASQFIRTNLEDTSWLSNIVLKRVIGKPLLGNVMADLRSRRRNECRKCQSVEELVAKLSGR